MSSIHTTTHSSTTVATPPVPSRPRQDTATPVPSSVATTAGSDAYHLDPPLKPGEDTPVYWNQKAQKMNAFFAPFLADSKSSPEWKTKVQSGLSLLAAAGSVSRLSSADVVQLRQTAKTLHELTLERVQAEQHRQGVENRSLERTGMAGEFVSRVALGAAVTTLAVGAVVMSGGSAIVSVGGAVKAGMVGAAIGGVAGGVTEACTQKTVYGKIKDTDAVAVRSMDGMVSGAMAAGLGAALPSAVPAIRGGLGAIAADGTMGMVGGGFEGLKDAAQSGDNAARTVGKTVLGATIGAAGSILVGGSVRAGQGFVKGALRYMMSGTKNVSAATEALDKSVSVVLYPRTDHAELALDDRMSNMARGLFLSRENVVRITKDLSLNTAIARAMAGEKGVIIAQLRVTASEFAQMVEQIETSRGQRILMQNCGNGAFSAVTQNGGVLIPAPLNQTPTLGMLSLAITKALGNSRVQSIRYVGVTPVQDALGASTAELAAATAAVAAAGYVVVTALNEAGETIELVLPIEIHDGNDKPDSSN